MGTEGGDTILKMEGGGGEGGRLLSTFVMEGYSLPFFSLKSTPSSQGEKENVDEGASRAHTSLGKKYYSVNVVLL